LTNLLGGHVDIMFNPVPAMLPLAKAHKLKALAVTSPRRLNSLPDVPTMAETGFPQIGSTSWYGALAPAKTPPALIKKLHDEFVSALQTADLRESLVAGGAEIVGNSPAQFALFLKQEIETARKLLKIIKTNLRQAYTLAGNNEIQDSGKFVGDARKAMSELLVVGEKLAKRSIGIPFFKFWKDA